MSKEINNKSNSKNKKSYNNRKKDFKSKNSKNSETDNTKQVTSTTNDISWYNSNPQLISDAARIPFGNQLGRAIDGVGGFGVKSVPGVCALKVVPGPGIADSVTDAVNISATNIFQYIRKNLSTYASYASADVMMYILAVDELYSMYNYIARIFGIANNFSAVNLYTPNALLIANGFNWETIQNFRENFNDYRARFNSLIYKAASIYMPVDISIVKRHMWMFGNYFVDSDTAKAQSYIYVPAGFHMLDETSNENGTMMKFVSYDAFESLGMEELLTMFNIQIETIRNSDSMLKIAADMRRAYENSSAWQLAYIPENFMIMPIHDENVLHQIMNTVILDAETFMREGVFDITQSVEHNKIIYKPQVSAEDINAFHVPKFAEFCAQDGLILNFRKADVSAEDIVEATRNMVLYSVDSITKPTVATIVSSGADICVGATVYVKNPEATDAFTFDELNFRSSMTFRSTAGHLASPSVMSTVMALHAFDWAPTLYINDFYNQSVIAPYCAYDNYAQVDFNNLKLLHEAVLTSMWQVPDFRLPTAGKAKV